MKLDFTEAARQFCREHEFNNVGLIHQAMLKGAEEALKQATVMAGVKADELELNRRRNLNPGAGI